MRNDGEEAGRRGEELAGRYLGGRGYRIMARNYRCRLGEIDLVADGKDGLVFVEVRTRRLDGMVSPEESVTRAKLRRVLRAAQHFLASADNPERPWRVDLVAIELDSRGEVVRLEHFENVASDAVLE